jgi:hypothetical protein
MYTVGTYKRNRQPSYKTITIADMSRTGPFDGERLFHAEELGPCRATVEVRSVRWRSGALRFTLTETFTPRPPARPRQVTIVDAYENGEAAVMMARRRVAQWRASSDRAHDLAPGGELRELRSA